MNIIQRKNKSNWVGHILRGNCLLKHVTGEKIEGRIEVTGRKERRCKKLEVQEIETGSTGS
jgi:hypothetical protein